MSDAHNLDTELRALLAQGQKLEALRRYREATGADLVQAKQAVEALERGAAWPETPTAGEELDAFAAEIVTLLKGGQKIQAIKAYRAQTGADLKDAKEAVEALAAKLGIAPVKAGCAGMLLLLSACAWLAWRLA